MSEFRDAIWDGLNAFLDGSADLVGKYPQISVFLKETFDKVRE